ncbi:MAG: hypothetical protein HeimC2_13400 [Candidatus Heimdallarchaeota archaeon LC_2]|nr:MAG: hypothetical protein HeimC2_13400 [Candidatus Heimdallarchaeota archaeon LC_2]
MDSQNIEYKSHFVSNIKIIRDNHQRLKGKIPFELNLISDELNFPMHLIVTGKNGSGKTSFLRSLYVTLDQPKRKIEDDGTLPNIDVEFPEQELTKNKILEKFKNKAYVVFFLGAFRNLSVERPNTIGKNYQENAWIDMTTPSRSGNTIRFLEQYLLERRAQQSFQGEEEGNLQKSIEIKDWFKNFNDFLCEIFGEEVNLEFKPETFSFNLKYSNGHIVNFNQLPDGIASIIAIWAELLVTNHVIGERRKGFLEQGIFIIDEIENHLHYELQRKIMKLIIQSFPRLQLIVSTHSPAIITSIPNALICDLSTQRTYKSKDLIGASFAELLKIPFSLDNEFDLETNKKLTTLQQLYNRFKHEKLNQEELEQMDNLAEQLAKRSHLLALEILYIRQKRIKPNSDFGDNQ